MYNLNQDEELTHYGQSLAEMEKMNDLVDSDSEKDEKGLHSGEFPNKKARVERWSWRGKEGYGWIDVFYFGVKLGWVSNHVNQITKKNKKNIQFYQN